MKRKSAIIPYRKTKDKLEILLVKNMQNTKWVIPKGTIEPPLPPHISATKEAYEEAGVLGKPHPIIVGFYFKNNQMVPAFLLEVDLELRDYDEKGERKRVWIKENEIAEYVKDKDLIHLLGESVKCINKKGHYFKYAVKTFCADNDFQYDEVSGHRSIIQIETDKGKKQRVFITRHKSVLEVVVHSKIKFKSIKDIPVSLAIRTLEENAENKIGFWSLSEMENHYNLSRMHNAQLDLMYSERFATILKALVNQCVRFEESIKKVKK